MSPAPAQVFAALGDPQRLELLRRLGAGAESATALAQHATISRQAVVKHLRVLESAGVVAAHRDGREVLFAVRPEALAESSRWLDDVAAGWDRRLADLKKAAELG
ncbi:MAG: metalloregulator ArsR/SmtB family transcription factor [Promicromonosporaceae bacterium]|nr:metalloregulator ArsR/SmtB family transcription factor [Promicromonosporaceae bacterium]